MSKTVPPPSPAYLRLARALLGRAVGFCQCPAQVLDDLVAESRFEKVREGGLICRRGEPFEQLTLVVEGIIEAGVDNPNGQRHLASYLTVGDLTGLLPCIDGQPFPHDTYAHTDALLMHIPATVLRRAQRSESSVALAVSTQLAARMRRFYEKLADVALYPARTRLARQLLELAEVYGRERNGRIVISERVPQHDLADLLGTSRQWTNKELNALERDGTLKVGRASIEILDMPALAAIAAAPDADGRSSEAGRAGSSVRKGRP